MEYQEIDFMQPIIDFIKTFPCLNLTEDPYIMPFNPNAFEGNALSYTGTTRPIVQEDVNGNKYISLQTNFVLYIRRELIDKISNKEQANFIANFERWVLLQDLQGLAPKFSNFENPDERFWADNGVLTDINEDTQVPYAQYMIQVHCEYKFKFCFQEFKENDLENMLNK